MTKCKQCNVTISDDMTVCPLCRCVVEAAAGGPESINEYPDVWLKERKISRAANIILLAVLGISTVLAVVNIAFAKDSWWCVIPIAALLYGYMAFRCIFVSRRGYRWKVFTPLILGLIFLVILDAETGFYRWSLNYVFPAGILVADLIILVLMLTNLKNWQSYMVMQIIMIGVSVIPLILWLYGTVTSPVLSVIAACITVFLFLGSLLIGDRTARGELRRRFHIR